MRVSAFPMFCKELDFMTKKRIIRTYDSFSDRMVSYFTGTSSILLLNDRSDKSSYQVLAAFLYVGPGDGIFSWENKTEDIVTRE
jgi:hypothetical protein